MKKAIHYFWLGILMLACSPENTNWESEWLAPIAKTTLNLQHLSNDNSISADSNDHLFLSLSRDLFTLNLDTLSGLEDIVSFENAVWPLGNFTIQPGNTIPLNPILIFFNVAPLALSDVTLDQGSLKIDLASVIEQPVNVKYTIPLATKNSVPIILKETIPAFSPGGDTIKISKTINLADYKLDLRTTGLNRVNRLEIFIEIELPPTSAPLALASGQQLMSVKSGMTNLDPKWVQGFLGTQSFSIANQSISLDFFKGIRADLFQIENVNMGLTMYQTLGAEMRMRPQALLGKNTRTGNQINLLHSIFGSTENIDRASLNLDKNAPIPIVKSWNFNPNNSNIIAFLENLPDEIFMNLGLELNPLGNVSGNKDFLFPKVLPRLVLDIHLPLSFSAKNLMFNDTVEANFTKEAGIKHLKGGQLNLHAKNKFPWEFAIDLILLDEDLNPLDTITSSSSVLAAPVDVNQRVTYPINSVAPYIIHSSTVESLKKTHFILIAAKLNTIPSSQILKIYGDYSCDIKIIADLIIEANP